MTKWKLVLLANCKYNLARDMDEEVVLVRRAKKGDRENFSQLVKNYTTKAYRIAFALLRDQADAEDAVQDAFVTAYRSIAKLQKEESFGSWLCRIVTSRAYDIMRKRKRRREVVSGERLSDVEQLPSHSDSWDLSLDLRWAIEHLPETHRLVVLLHYAEGATTDEIGYILDRPPGTVRRILSESYRLMRHYLEEEMP
jgi:RNA polymerase sigma-70 factor (ECF subfamily)